MKYIFFLFSAIILSNFTQDVQKYDVVFYQYNEVVKNKETYNTDREINVPIAKVEYNCELRWNLVRKYGVELDSNLNSINRIKEKFIDHKYGRPTKVKGTPVDFYKSMQSYIMLVDDVNTKDRRFFKIYCNRENGWLSKFIK